MKIDPDKVPGLTGSGYHAVVFLETNPDGSYKVFDPQKDERYDVPPGALEKVYVYAGSDSDNISGSYSSGGSGSNEGSTSGSWGDSIVS